LLSLGKLGFDATAFAVVLGAVVDFFVEEAKEFGEVGGGPTFDAVKERNHSRHFCKMFTELEISTTSDADKFDAFVETPAHCDF
jgi:hypothetical protein